MSSSPDRSALLQDDGRARPARLDAALRHSPYRSLRTGDPRLVDPVLERLVADVAEQAADEARQVGREWGYREGRAEAERAAQLRVEQDRSRLEQDLREQARHVQDAAAALHDAAATLRTVQAPAAKEIEDLAVRCAVAIAEQILGRELSDPGRAAVDAVRRALRLAPDGADAVVRLHPGDLATVAATDAMAAAATVRFVADETVQPGGCVLDAGACRIDAQVGPALARVHAAVGS